MSSLPSQMKAIVQPAYGGPAVLEYRDVARPVPTARQVLIKIHASSATAADGMMREGFPVVGRLFLGLIRNRVA
ncbi:MAG: NADPH:quinone reductase-like Zn-dependent oxidoreductase [Myxococcota bacterium]|jgi:NADPH:quinone reductase-like Zn-dependent oxidoreductase